MVMCKSFYGCVYNVRVVRCVGVNEVMISFFFSRFLVFVWNSNVFLGGNWVCEKILCVCVWVLSDISVVIDEVKEDNVGPLVDIMENLYTSRNSLVLCTKDSYHSKRLTSPDHRHLLCCGITSSRIIIRTTFFNTGFRFKAQSIIRGISNLWGYKRFTR